MNFRNVYINYEIAYMHKSFDESAFFEYSASVDSSCVIFATHDKIVEPKLLVRARAPVHV